MISLKAALVSAAYKGKDEGSKTGNKMQLSVGRQVKSSGYVRTLRYKGKIEMNRDEILKTNKYYWNTYADLWFGTTALPAYGVHFATEDELHLFGDVSGKKMLEICCGSGHSLKYHADRNAGELWGC